MHRSIELFTLVSIKNFHPPVLSFSVLLPIIDARPLVDPMLMANPMLMVGPMPMVDLVLMVDMILISANPLHSSPYVLNTTYSRSNTLCLQVRMPVNS